MTSRGWPAASTVATYRAEAAGLERREAGERRRRDRPPLARRDARDGAQRGRGSPTPSSAASWPTETVAEAIAGDRPADGGQPLPRRPARWARSTARSPTPTSCARSQERGLVFEILARPDQLEAAAAGLAGHEDLVVVVEHVGWPRSTADDERALWQAGIDALAAVGPNVHCKLSGPGDAGRVDGAPTRSRRGSSRPSSGSASTGASSPATSRSTACTAPSTSCGRPTPRSPPASTTSPATSSSPPTPSASTAAERRHRS